jgi:drug/metabolite transporter (DMT)-like permease
MLAFTLALSSSLCGGCADFLGGLQSRRHPLLTVLFFSQLTALITVGVAVAVRNHTVPVGMWIALSAAAGLSIAIALGALYRALTLGPMMIVAPIAAAGAVLPVLVGLARGETPGNLAVLGIVLSFTGIVLASRQSGTRAAAESTRGGIGLALLSAAAFGCFFLCLSGAASTDPLLAVFGTRLCFVILVILSLLVRRQRPVVKPHDLPPLMLVGGLDVGAATLFAIATTSGLLSVVSVLSSFPPLVTVLLARVVLRESIRWDQTLGVVCTLLGVCLIAV